MRERRERHRAGHKMKRPFGGKMKRRLLISLLSLALAATASHGQTAASRSSEMLLSECAAALRILEGQKNTDFIGATNCVGYIQGYRDGVAALAKTGTRSCVPQEATAGQLARVVVTHLQHNPVDLQLDRMVGVHTALVAAYPCPD